MKEEKIMNLKRIKDVAWGFCLVQLIWGFMQLIFNIISARDSALLAQQVIGGHYNDIIIYSEDFLSSIAGLLKTSAIIISISIIVTVLYLVFSNLQNKILSSLIFKISFSAIIFAIICVITYILYQFKSDVKIFNSGNMDINEYQYTVSAQSVVLVPYFSLIVIFILMIIECFIKPNKKLSLENKQENN